MWVTETGTETGAEAGTEPVGQGVGSHGPDGIRDGSGARGWRGRNREEPGRGRQWLRPRHPRRRPPRGGNGSRRPSPLDRRAKGANHLKGNFVDLEAFHGTSLVAAASRPSCPSDGSLAGRKEKTTRSARNLRGQRRMRDTADAGARRHTQIAAACLRACRTPLAPSARPRLPQVPPGPQRPSLIAKRPRADGILVTKRPRKTAAGARQPTAQNHATSNRHRTRKVHPSPLRQ